MSKNARVYLDHAATSWPKSECVLDAMDRFARDCGAASGRGGYRSAVTADQVVGTVRRTIGQRIGAESTDCVSFHANGTAALNAAIYGVLRPGDHVVVSAAEHNSVLRPLHDLARTQGLRLTIVATDSDGLVDANAFLDAVQSDTRLVAMTHASNVTGAVQPIHRVAERLADHAAWFLCDAAQSFGVIPIAVQEAGIDMLAAPGHKSSGGPLGTAFLYVTRKLHQHIIPRMRGGTGTQSESMDMPETMPTKLEAGNLNVPALAGWGAALDAWSPQAFADRREHALRLAKRLHSGLRSIPNVHVHGQPGVLPIASVTIDGLSPSDASAILDAEFGIETRSGLHCAALIHHYLGTEPEGTLRISAGHTTTESDIDAVLDALNATVSAMHPG